MQPEVLINATAYAAVDPQKASQTLRTDRIWGISVTSGNSRLSNEKLMRRFGIALPQWETCLEACYARLKLSGQADTGTKRTGL